MEMTVDKGRGYVTASEHIANEQEIGLIAVDSIYSPVIRVRYETEDARVGQKTDYDRLILEIWTNGTITPEMALVEATKILRKHLNPFVQYFELGTQISPAQLHDSGRRDRFGARAEAGHDRIGARSSGPGQQLPRVGKHRDRSRPGDKKTDAHLLKVRNFGKTTLAEVKRKLADLGLHLGMRLPAAQAMV